MAQVFTGIAFEQGGASLMARIEGEAGAQAKQADISSITYSVFDTTGNTPNTAITDHSAQALTVADVIFDALQTDSRWARDSTGYNFLHAIAATAFPIGNRVYEVEYSCKVVGGENFAFKYSIPTIKIRR